MNLTERDRKIATFLAPVLLFGLYWMFMLSPKREEASKAAGELSVQEQRRDAARQRVDQLTAARGSFAADYAELVQLGKAVPENVDMPTLMVQLQAAADGTGVSFTSIASEAREPAEAASTPPPAPGEGDGSQPAAAGGETAQSAPGGAAEAAGNAVTGANTNADAAASGVDPADTQTSATARDGGLPIGGGAAGAPAIPAGTSGVPGLDSVGISMRVDGDFFGLADFFHRLKRYVEATDRRILVRGRLITVDGISFKTEAESFPKLTAEITATAYLAPQAEGATAGATPAGPVTAASATRDSTAPVPPTATATAGQ